jgi:hypothetical protein
MQQMDIGGKKVAVFGLGDQVSYAENYADATGELHDVFESLGCQMMGYTSQEGYEHEDSKSIRGGKFCGLLCDNINQEELSEERVQNWLAQLRSEGFLEGGAAAAAASVPVVAKPVTVQPVAPPVTHINGDQANYAEIIARLEENNAMLRKQLENSPSLDTSHANSSFTGHYNPTTKSTMWTSADGRQCYYTFDTPQSKIKVSP